MSYTMNDKLPKDFFQSVIEEKAEMLRKYLRDIGDPLVFSTHIGPNMATFKFYLHQKKDSFKLHYTFSNLGRLTRTIIFLVGSIKLCLKGGVNIINEVNQYNFLRKQNYNIYYNSSIYINCYEDGTLITCI